MSSSTPINILLADDDQDDRFFFKKALEAIPASTHLTTVENGEKLMTYLSENSGKLPDVIFLDLNMPRKNGSECLSEIRQDPKLKQVPVVIYSTSLDDAIADELFEKGAHYYIRKCDLTELIKLLQYVLSILVEKEFARPSRGEFVINSVVV